MGVLEAIVERHLTPDRQNRIPFSGGPGQTRHQVGDA
jgi:hypothetical protein